MPAPHMKAEIRKIFETFLMASSKFFISKAPLDEMSEETFSEEISQALTEMDAVLDLVFEKQFKTEFDCAFKLTGLEEDVQGEAVLIFPEIMLGIVGDDYFTVDFRLSYESGETAALLSLYMIEGHGEGANCSWTMRYEAMALKAITEELLSQKDWAADAIKSGDESIRELLRIT